MNNVTFRQADIGNLPFRQEMFDHVFVCFTLEHIPNPLHALCKLKNVLRPGGTITVIEGDHGSALFYPETSAAHHVIDCLVSLQRQAGGNALIGRELGHLMADAGFVDITSDIRILSNSRLVRSSETDLHRDDRRCPRTSDKRRPHRPKSLGPGNPGPVPHYRKRWDVLLYVFQNSREKRG